MENITTLFLNNEHIDLVEEFCKESANAGFSNNSTIDAMKFGSEYDLGEVPKFWGILKGQRLISVSGCHRWKDPYSNPTMMRCLFRSATLPEFQKLVPGLGKTHMNSLPFSVLLPYQLNWGLQNGVEHFYITTSNSDHDASGKMKRTHRVMQLLSDQRIVKYAGDEIFYSTPQTKWEIHVYKFLNAIIDFHKTRQHLGIDLSQEYLDIIENGFRGKWKGFAS